MEHIWYLYGTWHAAKMELQSKALFNERCQDSPLYIHEQNKNKIRPLFHNIHRNQFLRVKVIRQEHYKTLRQQHRSLSLGPQSREGLL